MLPPFATVLHSLRSPTNVGTIVRSHVAFGGAEVVFVGLDQPWKFGKGTQGFSRRLERLCTIVDLPTDDALFEWCAGKGYSPIALEIGEQAQPLPDHAFPARPAFVVGSEGTGLAPEFVSRCHASLIIPQFGDVPCLNVAVSAAIGMYEFRRGHVSSRGVSGAKFEVPRERRVSMRGR